MKGRQREGEGETKKEEWKEGGRDGRGGELDIVTSYGLLSPE